MTFYLLISKENFYYFSLEFGWFFNIDTCTQKYSRLKFSSFFKEEPVYKGRFKVMLLLQVRSHDFEV